MCEIGLIYQKSCGKWRISTWFLVNGSMLTHGIIYEWSKYLKKITKVTYFRQAIIITTMSNQHLAKSMWKYASFHMVLGIWFHTHTWNQNWTVKISPKVKKDILLRMIPVHSMSDRYHTKYLVEMYHYPHSYVYMIPCWHMESYWNSQNKIKILLK